MRQFENSPKYIACHNLHGLVAHGPIAVFVGVQRDVGPNDFDKARFTFVGILIQMAAGRASRDQAPLQQTRAQVGQAYRVELIG
jgi:hypothetical protein